MDLSLEFPDRYHARDAAVGTCRDTCALEGMMNLFRRPLLWQFSDNSSIGFMSFCPDLKDRR